MTQAGSIFVKIDADVKEAFKGLDDLKTKMGSVGQDLKKVGGELTTKLTLPIALLGGASFKMASDFEESMNKVNVSFGDSADEVKAFAKETLKTYGIAEGTALDMAALFGDMSVSMGLSTDEASKMSTSMVGLAGDLASFKNVSIDRAQTALAGVYTGETEALKSLGIVMTEANLEQFAMSKGIQTSIKDMTQAEKVQLRYAYVMETSKNAQGDFANTSDGSANSMRIMTESLKELSTTFGQQLLPILTPIIQKVTEIVQWFGSLDTGTQSLIINTLLIVASLGPFLMIIGKIITIGGALIGIFTGISVAMSGATLAVGASKIAMVAYTITKGIMSATTAIATTVMTAFGAVMTFITSPIGLVVLAIAGLIAIGVLLWKNWDAIKEFAGKLWEGVKVGFDKLWNGIKNFFTSFMKGGIIGLINDYLLKPFFNIDLFKIGKQMIDGLIKGAGSMLKNMGKFFLDLVPKWIQKPFKLALGIKSPSKIFAGYGENITEGLVNGISDGKKMIEDTSMMMSHDVMGGFDGGGMDVTVHNEQQQVIEIHFGKNIYRQIANGLNDLSRYEGRTVVNV